MWCTISRSVIRFPIRAWRHELAMVGILVHGDNHFIVRGPLPGPRRCTRARSTLVLDSDRKDNTACARSMAYRLPRTPRELEMGCRRTRRP
jgi:hypothetical protein